MKNIEKLMILPLLFFIQCKTVSCDYTLAFWKSYTEAIRLLENESGIFDLYFPKSEDYILELAIVFPELIRFRALRDRLETAALKTLYVQYGKQYANFSIGHFQMKPTFAEELEKAWMTNFPKTSIVFDTLQCAKNRLKRVERLASQHGQMLYLYCFYKLMQNRLKGVPNLTDDDKVRLLATAYNRGFSLTLEELDRRSHDLSFHTAIWPSSETPRYCYASMAAVFSMAFTTWSISSLVL